jgi:hypothetical protein
MTFQEESISAALEEAKPLFKKHWEESESHYGFPLDPDYDLYILLQAQGLLRSYSARIDGKLVGYAVYLVKNSHHYKTVLMAKQDVVFIEKEFRTKLHFIQWTYAQLRNVGVKVIVVNVKAHNKTFHEYVYLVRL